ncbi:uncharacterized protein CCOS01_12645 [Colletotrichum costaricense]|uniref:Uncharacterized protein n=1 Tax=Colletotrichum costaricense TaxID=1209916 RepID=A0AAI9YMX2_9PEZI|nr:uncharacterized protein CCOS01_12645 [Colletotrichum costaricense]KAK1517096.1 hypothetical protein CCOS01_12645 [Colletotrichum costaricense]
MASPTHDPADILCWMRDVSGTLEDTSSLEEEVPIPPEVKQIQETSSGTAYIADRSASGSGSRASESGETPALTTNSTCTKRSSRSEDETDNESVKRHHFMTRASNVAFPVPSVMRIAQTKCSECKEAFMFSILCRDSYVPNLKTKTYSEQPMEQTICNDCQAETDFGSRILQGEHIAEPFPRGGAPRRMIDWYRQVRDEFETKAKLSLGDGMRPIDVSGMIHKEIFAEMESWLYFLKEDVAHRVQASIAKIETELDETHWWNRAGVDAEEEFDINPGYGNRSDGGEDRGEDGMSYEDFDGRWHGDETQAGHRDYDAANYTW